jgi:hypothetical protein
MHAPFVVVGERLGVDLVTWDRHWQDLFDEIARREDLPEPQEVAYEDAGTLTYGDLHDPATHVEASVKTLTVVPERVPDGVRAGASELAEALYAADLPPGGLAICTGMADVGGPNVRFLFALLRQLLGEIAGDPSVALYIPISMAGDADGTFPLHADLFPPQVLLNVFVDAPDRPEGATRLLPMARYEQIVAESVPADVCDRLLRYIHREAFTPDDYMSWYRLMYDGHPWSAEVKQRLIDACTRTHLQRGEGYLVDDLAWLHGRDYLSKDLLTYQRLQRLTFDTRATHRRRVQASGAARANAGAA